MVGQGFSRRLRLLGLTAAVALLAGCASAQAPVEDLAASPPPDDSTVEPTALEPEPDEAVDSGPLTQVTQIVIRPDSLEMVDSSGAVVETVDFFMGQADEAVAALTAVFGVPPDVEAFETDGYNPEGVWHVWEDKFRLTELHYDETRRMALDIDVAKGTYLPRLAVAFSIPTINGIDLVTVKGHQTGGDWEALLGDPEFLESTECPMGSVLDLKDILTPTGSQQAVAIGVFGGATSGVISFRAPAEYEERCF